MDRSEAITELIKMSRQMETQLFIRPTDARREALEMGAASLKADEAYQLEYEGVQNIVITEGMTNGDVMKLVFPKEVKDVDIDWFGEEWWNSPYKKE